MTARISINDQNGLITRRSIFIGVAASLICAPAIVRVTNLMPVRRLPFPNGPRHAGFIERLYLYSLENYLRNVPADQMSTHFNYQVLDVDAARRQVASAQAHGLLPPHVCIYRE